MARRDAGQAPAWDAILRTEWWDLAHAFGTSVEGWMCLVARHHVVSLADLTDGAAAELGPLVVGVSRALHAAVGCAKTYVVQFAEHPRHRHVHVHVVPRADDLPEEYRGPGVFSLLGVDPALEVSERRRDEIAGVMRGALGAA